MVRSRLPVPTLFCLFGALLMLCPELLMGNPEGLSDLPLDDEQLQNVLIFAVEQYNQDKIDDGNYYKKSKVLRAQSQSQVTNRDKYCLKVEMVKTVCRKSSRQTYQGIQNCRALPGKIYIANCFFKVTLGSSPSEMTLAMTACTTTSRPPPTNIFCSG